MHAWSHYFLKRLDIKVYVYLEDKASPVKESLGLEKKTTVSKALAESSNFGENKTEIEVPPWCSRPIVSIWDLSLPVQKPSTPTYARDLSPPAQLQMPSQLKNTQTSHLMFPLSLLQTSL